MIRAIICGYAGIATDKQIQIFEIKAILFAISEREMMHQPPHLQSVIIKLRYGMLVRYRAIPLPVVETRLPANEGGSKIECNFHCI